MLPDCLLPDGAPCRTAHADRVLDVNDLSMLPVLQLPNLLVDPACDAWLVLCLLRLPAFCSSLFGQVSILETIWGA